MNARDEITPDEHIAMQGLNPLSGGAMNARTHIGEILSGVTVSLNPLSGGAMNARMQSEKKKLNQLL